MNYARLKDVEFKAGSREYVSYLLLKVDVCDQKNGGKYLNMQIGDNGKVYTGVKLFGASENVIENIVAGKVFRGAIDAKEYNGGISLVVYNIEEDTTNRVEDFLSYEAGYEKDMNTLKIEIESLPDCYKALVQECIGMTAGRFWYWTAAMNQHHKMIGGLVVHTCEVLEYSTKMYEVSKVKEYCDLDVLRVSCILHDIGKCLEYKVDRVGNTTKDTQGILEGHIGIGVRMIDKAVSNLRSKGIEIDADKLEVIRHCILSHHGKLEYGSPVTPATVEAIILNMADLTSAGLNKIGLVMETMDCGEVRSTWTSDGYQNVYRQTSIK